MTEKVVEFSGKGVYFARQEASEKWCNSVWFIGHKYMVAITVCQTPRNILATTEIQSHHKHTNVRWTPLSVASLRETNEFTNIDGMK